MQGRDSISQSSRKFFSSVSVLLTLLLGSGCATTGGGGGVIPVERSTCVVIGGVIGAIKGAVIANNAGESETDEELAGGALGGLVGATLGYLLCGEGRAPAQPPTAAIRAEPDRGEPPLAVEFAARASDPDGRIVSYAWEFGDGSTGAGERVGHTYPQPGTYDVRLEVTDDAGLSATARARVEVVASVPAEEPAPTRRRIVLRGINFGFDSAQISEEDGLILDIAAEQLSGVPDTLVRVVGHTDGVGAAGYNQQLSQRRARAVVDYLVQKGLARDRLRAEGRGESEPVASNETPDGRRQNRRVTLELVE